MVDLSRRLRPAAGSLLVATPCSILSIPPDIRIALCVEDGDDVYALSGDTVRDKVWKSSDYAHAEVSMDHRIHLGMSDNLLKTSIEATV